MRTLLYDYILADSTFRVVCLEENGNKRFFLEETMSDGTQVFATYLFERAALRLITIFKRMTNN